MRFFKSNLFLSPTKLFRYPTNTSSYIVLYCNRFIILFKQYIHKKQTQKVYILNPTVQYLEKYSSRAQQLIYRDRHSCSQF